jgi:hypothetical protein
MKKFATAIALAGALTSGLIVAPSFAQSSAPSKSGAASNDRYCFKERLYTAGGEMSCNWATSVAEACRDFNETSRVATAAMIEVPKKSTRCANGEWLVQVTLK